MAITGTFEADFSSFQQAVADADVSLTGFQANASKVEAGLNRVANSLSGTTVIQNATLMAAAYTLPSATAMFVSTPPIAPGSNV